MQNEGMVRRDVVVRIERLIGTKVESYMPVVGGYTAAMRLLCRTTRTRFFAKIGTTPLTCQCLCREMGYPLKVGRQMPQWFQASQVVASSDGHSGCFGVTTVVSQLSRVKRIPPSPCSALPTLTEL